MQLDISSNSLPVYEALASQVRLRILQLISSLYPKKITISQSFPKLWGSARQ